MCALLVPMSKVLGAPVPMKKCIFEINAVYVNIQCTHRMCMHSYLSRVQLSWCVYVCYVCICVSFLCMWVMCVAVTVCEVCVFLCVSESVFTCVYHKRASASRWHGREHRDSQEALCPHASLLPISLSLALSHSHSLSLALSRSLSLSLSLSLTLTIICFALWV